MEERPHSYANLASIKATEFRHRSKAFYMSAKNMIRQSIVIRNNCTTSRSYNY